MGRPNPNPNIKDFAAKGGKSKSEIGKFRSDLGKFNREKVPEELLELFDWYKSLDTRGINYILELKNIYGVLKSGIIKTLLEKAETGKGLSKTELDQLRLAVDIMEKSHKLKFGDHKVIERVVGYNDIRKQIFSDKTVIKAKILEDDNRGDNGE